MIVGAHTILCSKDPQADRAFLRDVLGMPNVDVGDGWLIFGLPPAEVAVHPGKNGEHEFFLMCADAHAFVAAMKERKVRCAPVQDRGYGLMTAVTLPGGGTLGVYEARHARPKAMKVATKRRPKPARGKGRPK